MPAVYLMHSYCMFLKGKRAWRGLLDGIEKPPRLLQLCNMQNDVPNVVEEGTLIPTARNARTDLFSDLISSCCLCSLFLGGDY